LYVWFAVMLWDRALDFGTGRLLTAARMLLWPKYANSKSLLARGLGLVLIELIIVGFFRRSAFSAGNVLLAISVFLVPLPPARAALRWRWCIACMCASIFTQLSVEFGDDARLVLAGGMAVFAVAVFGEIRARSRGDRDTARVLAAQAYLVIIALALLFLTMQRLKAERGLAPFLCMLNWGVLLVSLVLPLQLLRVCDDALLRLLSLFVGWGTPYMMLSINYETLFLVALFAQLYFWLQMECASTNATTQRKPKKDKETAADEEEEEEEAAAALLTRHATTSLLLLFLTNTAFFGTGNIASVSSFELRSVLRFMAVFDPFTMGAMLLFKIALPFVLVAATFGLVAHLRGINRGGIDCVMLVLADIMSLHFFFLVRNEGSWKEIGQSISHFGITNFIIIVLQLLFLATRPFVANARLY